MTSRSDEWWRRKIFSNFGVQLGWGAEYWDPKPENYAGADALRARLRALGRRTTKRDLALRLANFLLDDFIAAACGVERALRVLRDAAAELKQTAADNGLMGDATLPRHGLAGPSVCGG